MNQAVARFVRPLPSREIWTFAGLVVLACFVWLAGPLFAFAEVRPLESGWARGLTIAVLFVAWGRASRGAAGAPAGSTRSC